VAAEEGRFIDVVRTSVLVTEVLNRAEWLALPDWYLTAGCLFQTVWNHLHDYEPGQGIVDYDLFYWDDSDLSWEAEDAVIGRVADVFTGVDATVQVRNQARVHLWFPDHFGIPIGAFTSSEDAIRNFLATACCVGMRTSKDSVEVCAPYGLDDLFNLVVKQNPHAAGPRSAYEKKTSRWTRLWPRLTIVPWSEAAAK
jgi:hypothetical protein